MEFKKGGFIQIILVILACGFTLISFGTGYWVRNEVVTKDSVNKRHIGLWKSCELDTGQIFCHYYADTTDWLRSCRAFAIISCIGVVILLALSIMTYVNCRISAHVFSLINFLTAASEVTTGLVFALENEWTNKENFHYDWSFGLAWGAVFFTFYSFCWAVHRERTNLK